MMMMIDDLRAWRVDMPAGMEPHDPPSSTDGCDGSIATRAIQEKAVELLVSGFEPDQSV